MRGGTRLFFVAGDNAHVDLGVVGPKVAEVLKGRGGGRGSIFRGKGESLHHRDKALEILKG